ncbi:hypothetical protein TNCV_1458251 [Trichonephila clavipes]|nr:hypothetical protein TNCV_1458251 [Trichonephila clavipes]
MNYSFSSDLLMFHDEAYSSNCLCGSVEESRVPVQMSISSLDYGSKLRGIMVVFGGLWSQFEAGDRRSN